MSTMAFVEGQAGVIAAWETEAQIRFASLTASAARPIPHRVQGCVGAKHPAVAVDDKGQTLLAWTEGTAWQKGGALVWQVLDESGRATDQKGRVESGIPVWGLPAVVATGGGFTIFH
jgi:hypothetical protein